MIRVSDKRDGGATDGAASSSPVMFHEPWWLDAVAPGEWRETKVVRNGELLASMPYLAARGRLFTSLTMPPITKSLGPWLRPSSAKYARRLAQEKDLLEELIGQLPPHDYFAQNFHYSVTNWLPFYWAGFQQTTRYTYILEDLADPGMVWNGLTQSIRTDVRKAERKVSIRTDLGLDHFLDINALTFAKQGSPLPYTRELVARVDAAAARRGQRKMYFAEDAEGRTHAAAYIVWNEQAAYYLMGGADPALRNSGATSLLLWQAIQDAAEVTESFDFEGSMIESIERFFRGFGATQKPYFHVWRMSRRRRALWHARQLLARP